MCMFFKLKTSETFDTWLHHIFNGNCVFWGKKKHRLCDITKVHRTLRSGRETRKQKKSKDGTFPISAQAKWQTCWCSEFCTMLVIDIISMMNPQITR